MIKSKLKEIMMTVDLEEVTSKMVGHQYRIFTLQKDGIFSKNVVWLFECQVE